MQNRLNFILCLRVFFLTCCLSDMVTNLKVIDSETRDSRKLDKLWSFRVDDSPTRDRGLNEEWFADFLSKSGPVIDMPVPSSYNDITLDPSIRDFIGWAWYETMFRVPSAWVGQMIVLRFEGAHYYTKVWLDGKQVAEHEGGHLPFEAEITDQIETSEKLYERPGISTDLHRITVAINNTLSPQTIPPGNLVYKRNNSKLVYPEGYFTQEVAFDFFNYAGIHRPVVIYTVPKSVHVKDISVYTSSLNDFQAILTYNILLGGHGINSQPSSVNVTLKDQNGITVATSPLLEGHLHVDNPQRWWPYTMNKCFGYLYSLEVSVRQEDSWDLYRLDSVGIRQVRWTNASLLVNGVPAYLTGINKHEDNDLRGKGLDMVSLTRDFNNQVWLGSNAFRTSHYPYAQEYLEAADRAGIMVIAECPAVGLVEKANFGPVSLSLHLRLIEEMIARDKNHPSIIAWSLANEPASQLTEAEPYFKSIFQSARTLDKTRPFTFACNQWVFEDHALQFSDLINLNAYFGWYNDYGHVELIEYQLEHFLRKYFEVHHKPVIMQEYGADSISGLHLEPAAMFSEEYQVQLMQANFHVFDKLRKEFFVGEFIWNYADFLTYQGTTRVNGNHKGIFTRQRQPKMAAHVLQERYRAINKRQFVND